jgi:class 3 adenylate cyclase
VALNDSIEYFGQYVNIAARVQGLADGNEVWVSQEVMDAPGVADIEKGHRVSADFVHMKGVGQKVTINRIAVA